MNFRSYFPNIRIGLTVKKMSKVVKRRNACSKKEIETKKAKDTGNLEDNSNDTPQIGNKVLDVEELGDEIWRPNNWVKVLENIREMRKNKDAPVDIMGCDKCIDKKASPQVSRFHSLVSLMLSSQTKDEVTFAAVERLKNYKSGLTIENILDISEVELGKLIYPVGFWKRKTKYLKETAKILKEKFNGDIPNTVELLQSLPGVGPKMAYLCMKSAWGVVPGIGVDTHVHRISNRIGWVKTETKTPEQTRVSLESWLPKNLWEEVNGLLVGFGQQICKPVKPLCSSCINQPLCPFGKKCK